MFGPKQQCLAPRHVFSLRCEWDLCNALCGSLESWRRHNNATTSENRIAFSVRSFEQLRSISIEIQLLLKLFSLSSVFIRFRSSRFLKMLKKLNTILTRNTNEVIHLVLCFKVIVTLMDEGKLLPSQNVKGQVFEKTQNCSCLQVKYITEFRLELII